MTSDQAFAFVDMQSDKACADRARTLIFSSILGVQTRGLHGTGQLANHDLVRSHRLGPIALKCRPKSALVRGSALACTGKMAGGRRDKRTTGTGARLPAAGSGRVPNKVRWQPAGRPLWRGINIWRADIARTCQLQKHWRHSRA